MAVVVTAVAAAFVEGAATAVILTAVTEVGVALSVVGAVTKSPELMKLGGAMSLVGGVGGIVNGLATGAAGAATGAMGEGAADAAAGTAEAGWSDIAGDAVAGMNASSAAPIAFDGAGAAATGAAADSATSALASGANSSLNSLASNAAVGSGTTGISDLSQNASGLISTPDTSSPYLNDYGLPKGGEVDKVLGVDAPSTPFDIKQVGMTQTDQSMAAQLKAKLGGAWDSLGPLGRAEVLKSALAMPGGIQNQKNVEASLAIQQQKANQSSYGSQVPTFGIINKAKG